MKKLLVANRSEIACRVFQACRERGLGTVAIFAPGDEEARHLTFADEVYPVPSYLDTKAIIEVAKKSGAQYIHPGYGFLSERPVFAKQVEAAGLHFLGPRAETMELMGGKIEAKELAEKEGVPTLPWVKAKPGADLSALAKKIGFPLLIKASAGGGGKGMRRVNRAQDFEEAAESAIAEVKSAFGDPTIFLERLVENPRHIEVQVFGDGKGEGVALFERECSLQRRHQKVWEEAPALRLSEKTKLGLYEAALKLLRKTKYRSAGTIEFLVDDQEKFYFLEMNTRLQVEHPVTEAITGIDLVCAQIDLATGDLKKMPTVPAHPQGHAIEVRLYAEDPAQGFIPSSGVVTDLVWPSGPGIRVDAGVELGQTVHTLFDSMLAKLIVWAPTREHALARLRYALEETVILGVGTNQSYLYALTQNAKVKKGQMHTEFLENEFGDFAPKIAEEDRTLISAVVEAGLGKSSGASLSHTKQEFASPWFSGE